MKFIIMLLVALVLIAVPTAQGQVVTKDGISVELIDNTDYCEEECYGIILVCGVSKLDLTDVGLTFKTEKGTDTTIERSEKLIEKDDVCWKVRVEGTKGKYENVDWIPSINSKEFPEFAWWNTTWVRKRGIPITIGDNSNISEYAVYMNITNLTNMNDDLSDWRFIDNDNATELNYWIQDYVTDEHGATYVEYMDEGNGTIWLYYDNASVVNSQSNGLTTFDYFDGIEGGIGNWTHSVVRPNGVMSQDSSTVYTGSYSAKFDQSASVGGFYTEFDSLTDGTKSLIFWVYKEVNNADSQIWLESQSGDIDSSHIVIQLRWESDGEFSYHDGVSAVKIMDYAASTWYKIELNDFDFSGHTSDIWVNGVKMVDDASFRVTDNLILKLTATWGNGEDHNWYFDNLIITDWHDPEPTASLGSEEILPGIDVDLTSPTNSTYTDSSIWVNVTTTVDANTCVYSLDGAANVTLGGSGKSWYSLVSVTTPDVHHVYVWCNETGGGTNDDQDWFTYVVDVPYDIDYNAQTFETATETYDIAFNLTGLGGVVSDINSILNYNGTEYSATSVTVSGAIETHSFTISMPETATGNVTLFWNYTVDYSSGYNHNFSSNSSIQIVNLINITNCTSGSIALNLLMRDEANQSAVYGNIDMLLTVTAVSGGYTVDKTIGFDLSNQTEFSFCIDPDTRTFTVDADIFYDGDGYGQRSYYLDGAVLSTTAQNITLYLSSGDPVIVYVKDSGYNPVSGETVTVQRYYSDTGTYRTVMILKTDGLGKDVAYFQLDTVFYRFILSRGGVVDREYSSVKIPDTLDDPEELTLFLEQTSADYFEFRGNVAYTCQFINATNTTSCTVTDSTGLTSLIELEVWKSRLGGAVSVCDLSDSGSSVTLGCFLGNNNTNEEYYWKLYATTSTGYRYILIEDRHFFPGNPTMGTFGLFLAIIVILVAGLMAIWSPPLAGIFAVGGLALSVALGLVMIGAGSVISLMMIAFLIAIKGRG